jgi:putative transposase
MKTMNLPKMSTFKPPKQKSHSYAEGESCKNLLQQQFKPEKPNMAWVCDFTYIRAGGRFYYLCAIMDLFSRKIIAFRLSARINTDLAVATLEDAIRTRGVSSGVMFHTDRGSQFTAKRFRQFLDQHNMIQSFSAKGYPYDNAVMECFFRYLKHEETDRRSYSSLPELQDALFRYIHGFYNSMRPHSHNNELPPIAAEEFVT